MRRVLYCCFLLFVAHLASAQHNVLIKGKILDARSKRALKHCKISVEGFTQTLTADANGNFQLTLRPTASYQLLFSAEGYIPQRILIEVAKATLDLGVVFLEKDIKIEKSSNLFSLTESELLDDELSGNTSGLLQATRDVFLNRAAFDFGQAFFRVRGYDSQNGNVMINGIKMNKLYDGRPQWNNWGGLNDVTRNQEYANGLATSNFTFGGILGTTNIDMRPSGLRPGARLSSSFSNRTYSGRLMATYTSNTSQNGLAYAISGSRRWAKQGYINGTLYDAFSFFGALEYQFNKKNSIVLTGIFAQNRRGRSSAITEEVYELVGKRYNPYWGLQNNKIRNSRERKIAEPIVMLNYYMTSDTFNLNTAVSYQFGENSRSRLGYYNAPNPDPTYYRYLPSFYINSPIGANFISANSVKTSFVEDAQLNWANIYSANAKAQASFVLYDDMTNDVQFNANSIANWRISNEVQLDFGISYRKLDSDNFARVADLFGAEFHLDIDPFSNTRNDTNGTINKKEDDIFKYHYQLNASQGEAFLQLNYARKKWNAFAAAQFRTTDYQRNGLFENQRFSTNAAGKSETITFSTYGLKSGLNYKITDRHWFIAQGMYGTRPPVLQNVFINPRENNFVVPQLQNEKLHTTDLNYIMRMPALTSRITGYYSRFQNTTDINFFFVDAGVGSDFVQEVLTDLDKLHLGLEFGLEYQLSSTVKLSAVAALGKYVYASNPNVNINFDTVGSAEDLINLDGNINLGTAQIKGYKLAQGPQQAFALGIDYRDPKYWWVSTKLNYLANNYSSISTITRTQSFYQDPDTGVRFSDATSENVNALLTQTPLDNFYLLNVVGGKSWLKNGKYVSVFASVNNLFDAVFRTGGYEQSRNGNFAQLRQDTLSGTPSFAPKYWYGYGRTYFLNLAYSF